MEYQTYQKPDVPVNQMEYQTEEWESFRMQQGGDEVASSTVTKTVGTCACNQVVITS